MHSTKLKRITDRVPVLKLVLKRGGLMNCWQLR